MEKRVSNASLAHTRGGTAALPARLAIRANTRSGQLQSLRAHARLVQSTQTHSRGRHHLRSACATQGIQVQSPRISTGWLPCMPTRATLAMRATSVFRTWNRGLPSQFCKGPAAHVSQASSNLRMARGHALSVQQARSRTGLLEGGAIFVRGMLSRLQAATTSLIASATRATRGLTASHAANAWQGASRRLMVRLPASCVWLANIQMQQLRQQT